MRIGVVSLALCAIALVGCSSPEATKTTRKPTPGDRTRRDPPPEDVTLTDPDDADPILDGEPSDPLDSDGDGVPDAQDCEPGLPSVGMRLLEDDLATDKGLFASAEGFPAGSWAYDGGYSQIRLADAADTSLFVKNPSIEDALVEVRAASTEVSSAFTPRLRQIFVVLGATIDGGRLAAVACGVEVDATQSPEQRTSIVALTGPPTNVTTTGRDRVARPALQANEEFSIQARLSKGTLTCRVTQGEGGAATSTVATASGLGTVKGSVGFFTRQTKAVFKQARICKLN